MNTVSYILLGLVAVGLFFALRAVFVKKKTRCGRRGGCDGCSGCR